MSTIPSLKFEPLAYNTGIAYSQLPTDGTGDFTVARNTICQEINSVGASVDVAVNVPRYDFKAPYVAPVDNSYYSFNGTVSNYVSLDAPTVSSVTLPFGLIAKIKTGSDVTTEQSIYVNVLDSSNRLTLGIRNGKLSLSTYNGVADNSQGFVVAVNTEYYVSASKDETNTLKTLYLNGVSVATTSADRVNGGTANASNIGVNSNVTLPFLGSVYYVKDFNFEPTASFFLDRFNEIKLPSIYKGVTNVNTVLNGAFVGSTNWGVTGESTASTGVGRIYSSIGASSTLAQSGKLFDGDDYILEFDIIGTSSGTVLIGNIVPLDSILTGLTGRQVRTFTAGSETDLVFKRGGVCDTSIDNVVLRRAGNTLNLSTGKTASNWYDLDHNIQGVITGATLTNSTDFGNNIHPLSTCPVLRTETSFTNYFINSSTPVTQTITTVIGTKYTFNCKGLGLATFDEVGGNGVGGTFTEVYPNTYTATATSVTVTLVGGHAFDFVQLSNTSSAMNHVPTAVASVTKAQDAITLGGDVNTFDSTSGVLEVKMSALELGSTFRLISISDGTTSNRVYLGYGDDEGELIFGVDVGGVTSYFHSQLNVDTTVENIFRLKWSNSDFGVKIGIDENNMVEVSSQSTGAVPSAGTFDRLNFNNGGASFSLNAKTSSLITYKGITQY